MYEKLLAGCVVVAIITVGVPRAAHGQLDRIRKAVGREIEQSAEKAAVNATRCALRDTRCVENAKRAGKPVVLTDANDKPITDEHGRPVTDPGEASRTVQPPGEGVWRNYDFVPGKTVWKATDFSSEPVGRFPARQLEFVRGNMQVVEFEGMKMLEATSSSVVQVKLPSTLPNAFSVEFALRIPTPNIGTRVFFSPMTSAVSRYPNDYLYLYHTPGIHRAGREVSGTRVAKMVATLQPVRVQVRDEWAIMYVGSERVSQVPTANFARGDVIEFHLDANARFPTYLTDVVVAVGLDNLYEALMAKGEVTTRGILFDVDSDRLRPESTPVLLELTTALKEHADLRVAIEGHTDARGDDAHNMALSERRARAVVNYLTAQGVSSSRLQSVGKGESVPVADNATAEGRQQNRRVVVRRQP